MRDGICLYWDRDETAIAATAKKFKDCEDAEECVDEIAGLLYAMPEITGVDLDLIKSAREYPAKTDYRTKYELFSVVMMIYFMLKEIIDENK